MKTLKFAVIAALVVCTMSSITYADGIEKKPDFKKVVNLTLQQAYQVPGLIAAMYAQIDNIKLLNKDVYGRYVAEVTLGNTIYRISGTYAQWLRFFNMKGESSIYSKQKWLSSD